MKFRSRIPHPATCPPKHSAKDGSRIIWVCGLIFLATTLSAPAAEWVELAGCRLVKSSSNDADSFVAECSEAYRGEKENRFRLYFIDAAETDSNSDFKKERLKEQAAYWGSSDPDFALRMGLRASQTVQKILRSEFTVYTRGEYAPTLGRPRYYALVKVKDRWLDEILAEQGLVRIYGKGAHLPDRTNANTHRARLRQLERAAKAARRNGWRNAADEPESQAEPAAFEPHDAKTSRTAWLYSTKDGRKVTALPKGTSVTVVAPEEQGKLRVRFKKNGKVYEGLCEQQSLK